MDIRKFSATGIKEPYHIMLSGTNRRGCGKMDGGTANAKGGAERMTQRPGPCPQNCPDRHVNEHETCHSTCQRYMRYKLTKLLEGKQRAKAIDEVGFHRDVRRAVEKKRERKIRHDNR